MDGIWASAMSAAWPREQGRILQNFFVEEERELIFEYFGDYERSEGEPPRSTIFKIFP